MKEDPTLASAVCERGGITDRSCQGCYWHYSPGVRSQAAPKRQNVHLVGCLERSVSCRGDLQGSPGTLGFSAGLESEPSRLREGS